MIVVRLLFLGQIGALGVGGYRSHIPQEDHMIGGGREMRRHKRDEYSPHETGISLIKCTV